MLDDVTLVSKAHPYFQEAMQTSFGCSCGFSPNLIPSNKKTKYLSHNIKLLLQWVVHRIYLYNSALFDDPSLTYPSRSLHHSYYQDLRFVIPEWMLHSHLHLQLSEACVIAANKTQGQEVTTLKECCYNPQTDLQGIRTGREQPKWDISWAEERWNWMWTGNAAVGISLTSLRMEGQSRGKRGEMVGFRISGCRDNSPGACWEQARKQVELIKWKHEQKWREEDIYLGTILFFFLR